ncbi:MAG: hypothetical protein R6V11_05935 [Ectothiorhodospiraceae bacterium]
MSDHSPASGEVFWTGTKHTGTNDIVVDTLQGVPFQVVHKTNAARCRHTTMTKTDEQIETIVNRVLAERVGLYGFDGATVRAGVDHDGDAALFIEARYALTKSEIDAGAFYGLTSAVRAALAQTGEDRFPYIRHRFDERQQVAV